MCGILFAVPPTNCQYRYKNALNKLIRRGPDSNKLVVTEKFVCGSTRLAIRDLRDHANQPMYDTTKRFVIAFNGEIYNYQELKNNLVVTRQLLRTTSDTEVLLYSIIEHGIDTTVRKAKGMFAFVFLDTQTDTFYAARDHFGQKPIYYYQDQGMFCLASDVRSILELTSSTEPDITSYKEYYFGNGTTHPGHTFFDSIHALPAGNILEGKGTSVSIRRYFSAPELFQQDDLDKPKRYDDVSEVLSQLDKCCSLAIRTHLISDRPIGVLLSGGLDSSLVHYYAKNILGDIATFTKISTGIENVPSDVVPQIIDINHECSHLIKDRIENYLSDLYFLTEEGGAPAKWGGGPPLFRLCSKAKSMGVSVLLGGDGVDEYFGGYTKEILDLRGTLDEGRTIGDYVLNTHLIKTPFKGSERLMGFAEGFLNEIAKTLKLVTNKQENACQSLMLFNLGYYLQVRNLPHGDVLSSAASVEMRNPLLDLDLVKFVINLPFSCKFDWVRENLMGNKILLRQLGIQKIGRIVDVPKEGTRNYGRKISESRYWDLSKFEVTNILELPMELSGWKDYFRLINLELFHRCFFCWWGIRC